MSADALPSASLRIPEISRQILSIGIGLAASWLIFYGLSRVQYRGEAKASPPIEDLRTVEIPMEPPPPPVRVQEVPVLTTSSLIIVAPERSDSVVKLPDVPILRETVPPVNGLPKIDFAPKIFKPTQIDSEFETRHVYQPREVDQRCVALVKARPEVSKLMLRSAPRLRVEFICIVNRDGSIEGVRLTQSSGSRDLDLASAEAFKNWRFSPALRRGRAVRQWVQQSFFYKVEKGSPLEVN